MQSPEVELSPYDIGGSSLADSARNLMRSLEAAPALEPEKAAALRRQLIRIASDLAERWSAEPMPIYGKRSFGYHRTLWKLRDFAVELGTAEEPRRSGISVVLQALCDRFMPGSLQTLRPAGLATITAREHMGTLRERLLSLGIGSDSEETGAPERILAVRYPAGEQDNSLMASTTMDSAQTVDS